MIKEFMSVKKLPKNPSLLLIESKGFKWLIVVNVETEEMVPIVQLPSKRAMKFHILDVAAILFGSISNSDKRLNAVG